MHPTLCRKGSGGGIGHVGQYERNEGEGAADGRDLFGKVLHEPLSHGINSTK